MRSFVEVARDIIVHDVYRTRNLSLTSSDIQPPDEILSVRTHEIFSHVTVIVNDVSAYHLLFEDFNIYHLCLGGISIKPDCTSPLLLSL
jgi:hypothetical protein